VLDLYVNCPKNKIQYIGDIDPVPQVASQVVLKCNTAWSTLAMYTNDRLGKQSK